jgi:hypothetical protein
MRTTRSKTTKQPDDGNKYVPPPSKSFQKIPVKIDESLFQKRNGCIDAVPAPIFEIIQLFLNEHDYRELLNSSLLLFQSIKYQTVRYTFKGPDKWNRIGGFSDKKAQRDFFAEFIRNNVRDKSKQVVMNLNHPPKKDLVDNQENIQGIARVTFWAVRTTDYNNWPLMSIFSNIHHVLLCNVDSIQVFPEGLQNVVVLEIFHWMNLTNLNALHKVTSLKKLTVKNCFQLNNMNLVTNIPEMTLQENSFLHNYDFFLGNQTHLSLLHYVHLPVAFFTKFSRLQVLVLNCQFPDGAVIDFSAFQQIPLVSLHSRRYQIILPVFYGRQLKLHNFKLTSWEEVSELPNVEILELEKCEIGVLPSMPNLRALKIRDCYSLLTIPYFPKLRRCFIDGGNKTQISDVSTLSHLYHVYLRELPAITNISCLGDIPHLYMYCLDGLKSLQGLGQVGRGNSEMFISYCRNLEDLSPVKNLFRLHLHCLDDFRNAEQVSGVTHLHINRCNGLKDTRPLGKVQSLAIVDCYALEALRGLENVPKLVIERCQKLEDFSGIGRNKLAVFSFYKTLKEMWKEYQTKGLHGELFENIEEFRFDQSWSCIPKLLSRDETYITFESIE